MKRNWFYSSLVLAGIFFFVATAYGHGTGSQRQTLAVGPDGLIYAIIPGGMMGEGPGHDLHHRLKLLAVDRSGVMSWSFDIEGFEVTSAPVIAPDGTVYFTAVESGFDNHHPGEPNENETHRGRLFAVKNGQLKWGFDFEGMMASAPVLAPDGRVYFTTSFFDDAAGMDGMGPAPGGMMEGTLFALRDAQTEALPDWKLEFDGPMISQPVIYTGVTGFPWVMYVSVSGMGHGHGPGGGDMMSDVNLYEIHPDGSSRRVL